MLKFEKNKTFYQSLLADEHIPVVSKALHPNPFSPAAAGVLHRTNCTASMAVGHPFPLARGHGMVEAQASAGLWTEVVVLMGSRTAVTLVVR